MSAKKGRVRNNIHALRTARGWSQAELADKVGATRQTINAIEQEKYAPSLELAFRIAHLAPGSAHAVARRARLAGPARLRENALNFEQFRGGQGRPVARRLRAKG